MSVSDSFIRIESWLAQNAPGVLQQLNPPISSSNELDQIEEILGAKFPPSVREAYLYHNGESNQSKGLFGSWRWLSLKEILEWNNEQKQNVRKYRFIDFKPSFMIPLFESTTSNNDLRYVETSGDNGNEETPVIEWKYHNPTRDVKYGSFANYLSTFAERLENGEYIPNVNDPQQARGLILKD